MKRHELAKERFPKRWEQQERYAFRLHHFEYKGFDCYTDSYAIWMFHEKMTDQEYTIEMDIEKRCFRKEWEYIPVTIKREDVFKAHEEHRKELRARGEKYIVPSALIETGTGTALGSRLLLDTFKFMAERELTFMIPKNEPLKPVWTKNTNGDYAIVCPVNKNYRGY